jgi:hypothetical protein
MSQVVSEITEFKNSDSLFYCYLQVKQDNPLSANAVYPAGYWTSLLEMYRVILKINTKLNISFLSSQLTSPVDVILMSAMLFCHF